MRHGSLFSGIGGFDLAAEWMGWKNVFHCEWMPFPRKILHYYWPKSISYEDITKTDFNVHRGDIDILTGGFPCQPYSSAGKRLGKEDERHLWPHMLRAIREIQPSWVVGENVRGLTNWNGGLVFDEVQADLEAQGYEVLPFLLPACAVGAPHRRDRIWFVAYCDNNGFNECNSNNEINTSKGRINALCNVNKSDGDGDAADTERVRLEYGKETGDISEFSKKAQGERSKSSKSVETNGGKQYAADTDGNGLQRSVSTWCNDKQARNRPIWIIEKHIHSHGKPRMENKRWENFPTVSPVCDGDDGLSDRLDSITFSKWRQESIKGGGNAIVPQVALQIFRVIQQMSNLQDDAGVRMSTQNNPSP